MSKTAKPNSVRNSLTKRNAAPSSPKRIDNTTPRYQLDCVAHVAEALCTSTQPLPVQTLVDQIQDLYPQCHNASILVNKALNKLFQAVPVSPGHYGWLTHLLAGNAIRHPLTIEEMTRGFLMMDELEHAVFFPQFFQFHRPDNRSLQIELFGGPVIAAEAYIERKTWSLSLGAEFAHWLDEQGGEETDDLLIMINDADAGHYTLRLHPREARNNSAIHSRNIRTALLAEDLVRQRRHTDQAMPTWELAALLIGRGIYATEIPPDDLHCVLHQYSLLHYNGAGYVLKAGADHNKTEEQHPSMSHSFSSGYTPNPIYDSPLPEEGMEEISGQPVERYQTDDAHDDESHVDAGTFAPDGVMTHDGNLEHAYHIYLDELHRSGTSERPLPLEVFELLKSELDALIALEQKFGYLLVAQQQRRYELLASLLMDDAHYGA